MAPQTTHCAEEPDLAQAACMQDVYAEDLVHRAPGDASTLAPMEAAFGPLAHAWLAAETGAGQEGTLAQTGGALQCIREEEGQEVSAKPSSTAGALLLAISCSALTCMHAHIIMQ